MRTIHLAAVGVFVLIPAAHAAVTTCLTEAFTLDDQRALAALRTETDASCPCGSAASRSAYQRCAKGVIDAAIIGSALRPDCKSTARTIAKGASCGSTKVPCGRVRRSDEDVDCKLSKATSCVDNSKFDRTACSAQTHCADVVDWTAGTCFDVRQLGPFAPGYRTITYTKDSVVNPGTPRVLTTSIWYPAPAGSGPIAANTGGVADAPLDPSGGPYPIVMFSHGSCGIPTQSKFLTPLLASYGFVVVAPPHPGNTLLEFPNCNQLPAQVASLQERPQDIEFVLNQIIAANADSASFLVGVLDTSRIGMMGHSFGGLTTYLVQAIDPRITVAVPLAPAALGNPHLTVPSLTMIGDPDTIVNNALTLTAFANSLPPKILVQIDHSGHYAFSDNCFALVGCNPPTTLTPQEVHPPVLRFVLPFLKVHLAGDMAWTPFLQEPVPSGLHFTAE